MEAFMKKILFAWALLTASFAHAQSVDISTLSAYEQTVHRLSWCRTMGSAMLREKVPSHPYDVSFEVYNLMDNKGYFDKDWDENGVIWKTANDLEAEILLGKTFSSEEAAACEKDAKSILKEEYVPNFSYVSK